MDPLSTMLEIAKYTIPALIVMASSFLIVRNFLVAQMQRKHVALFKDSQDVTLKLRLQAYERMVLLVERISPRQLVSRVYDSTMTVRDLQIVMTMTIKTEFEHNMAQQIYVSQNVWQTVKGVKEQEINMINQLAQSLNPEAPAKELHAVIMNVIMKADDELPTDVALKIINSEVAKVLSMQA